MSELIASEDVRYEEIATFGTGCFWHAEAIFQQLKGVTHVECGYAGGNIPNISYEEVKTGNTGAVEVCKIKFNPSIISFPQLLKVFFEIHDPTSKDKQGNNIGSQYKSAVFYHTKEQEYLAKHMKESLQKIGIFNKPIITEILPLTQYTEAEKQHQNYYKRNPKQPYCQFVIKPNLEKFEKIFADLVK